MSLLNFPTEQIVIWENQLKEGGKAKNFKSSQEWAWFDETILKTIEEQAINTLKNAKDDVERMKSQQMFLAADKPRQLLDALISQGDAAKVSLMEISTLKEGDNDGMA